MSLSLSKKRQKELDKLKAEVDALVSHQRDVLGHAGNVAKEANRQVGFLAHEQLYPRVQQGIQSYVVPTVNRAGDVVSHTLVPAVGTAIGTALSVADVANDTRVKAAVKRLKNTASTFTRSSPVKKKRRGIGTYVAVGVGVAALAGVAYAVWQTFRADDELWVADEPDTDAPATETPGTETPES